MIHKNRANRRRVRMSKSRRKFRIISETHYYSPPEHISELSKAKIHCSCPLCSAKSKRAMGKRYRGHDCWKVSDRRKFESMAEQIKELECIA